ncbi:MAG: hypothetical protein WA628_04045 [Terriglobales bacterium]
MLSVTWNAAGIVPSANNRFPAPNVIGNIFSQNDQIMLEERLNQICASIDVQIRPFLLLDFGDSFRNISV